MEAIALPKLISGIWDTLKKGLYAYFSIGWRRKRSWKYPMAISLGQRKLPLWNTRCGDLANYPILYLLTTERQSSTVLSVRSKDST